jgi:hypothetical protein
MALNPAHYGSLTYLDFSEEKSAFSFNFDAVTALNIAAFLADFGDLRNATNAIVLGSLVGDQWTGDRTKYSAAPPVDVDAQRERKFLVIFEDTVNLTLGRAEIPTADFAGRLIAGTDLVDLTDADIVTWIAAYEVLCRSDDGNTVNVIRIEAVGRNI